MHALHLAHKIRLQRFQVIEDIVLRHTVLGVITFFRIAQDARLQLGPFVFAYPGGVRAWFYC